MERKKSQRGKSRDFSFQKSLASNCFLTALSGQNKKQRIEK